MKNNILKTLKVQEDGKLIDLLFSIYKDSPKKRVKTMLKNGQIKVDSIVKTHFSTDVIKGQEIVITKIGYVYKKTDTKLDIIYEDSEIIAINKPAGLLSISTGKENEATAYHLVYEYVQSKNLKNRIYSIHRLDKATSGVLIFAKNEETKTLLQDNWEKCALKRCYTAVIEGHLSEKSGIIRSWLKENSIHKVYSSYSFGDGKEAVTKYEVIRDGEEYSLVKFELMTGRKNQIRVHMYDKHCPIAGDKKYGASTNPLKRLCLHADTLIIKHPITGKEMIFKANVPRRFAGLVKHGQ